MDSENELMYPPESTVGDQCLRVTPEISKTAAGPPPQELRRRISVAAYDLYLRRGKRRGHDLEDWLEAEASVLSQLSPPVREIRSGAIYRAEIAFREYNRHFHKIC